jgi:hypothetical protein
MANERFRVRDVLGATMLAAIHLSLLLVGIHNRPAAELISLPDVIIYVVIGCVALTKINRRGALCRAGAVLDQLPTEFPWRLHILLGIACVFLTLAFRQWYWHLPAVFLSTAAPIGLFLSNLADRKATLCEHGVVYVNLLFPWSSVSAIQTPTGSLRCLQIGRSRNAVLAIVPADRRIAATNIFKRYSPLPSEAK